MPNTSNGGMIETLLEATGDTPLLKLSRGVPVDGAAIYAKVERFNPGVSIKDRTVIAMMDVAEAAGDLKPGATVLEAVAGNTGVALAHLCRVRGYELILTMPEDYMPERQHVLARTGVKIVTTAADDGVRGAKLKAARIKEEHPDYFVPDHFSNQAQVEAHRTGLVEEILADLDGKKIDAFVGGIGTGSSLIAIAERFRPQGTKVVVVEPAGSPLLSAGRTGKHSIPGIGFDELPEYLDRGLIDRVEVVTDEEARLGFRDLAASTGVLAGLSSGANYHVAKKLSQELGEGKNILTLFYDGGERYFSLENELKQGNGDTL